MTSEQRLDFFILRSVLFNQSLPLSVSYLYQDAEVVSRAQALISTDYIYEIESKLKITRKGRRYVSQLNKGALPPMIDMEENYLIPDGASNTRLRVERSDIKSIFVRVSSKS